MNNNKPPCTCRGVTRLRIGRFDGREYFRCDKCHNTWWRTPEDIERNYDANGTPVEDTATNPESNIP